MKWKQLMEKLENEDIRKKEAKIKLDLKRIEEKKEEIKLKEEAEKKKLGMGILGLFGDKRGKAIVSLIYFFFKKIFEIFFYLDRAVEVV